jgi:glycosyltransferase involved in cell wall biosynthesis
MAAGLPVIGSIYGGESELVEEGVNGWVSDPADIDDLADALQLAWEARDQLPQMGERARESVSRMAIDKVAARIRNAVGYALHKGKRPTQSAGSSR